VALPSILSLAKGWITTPDTPGAALRHTSAVGFIKAGSAKVMVMPLVVATTMQSPIPSAAEAEMVLAQLPERAGI
jgi:hypothetical protein